MALTMKNRKGGIPVSAFAEATFYHVAIDAQESGAALEHQDEAVVTSFSRSTDGVYVLTFAPRFKRVCPVGAPNVRANGDWTATAVPVEGNQTNTVTVRTYTAGTLDDPDAVVDVGLWLVTTRHNGSNG